MANLIQVGDDSIAFDAVRQRSFWDTVTLATGAHTAGSYSDLFNATSSKTLINSNISENSRLPSQWSAIIYRVRIVTGVNTQESIADAHLVNSNFVFQFWTNDTDLRIESPVYDFPAGVGTWAFEAQAGTATDDVVTSNGLPSLTSTQALESFGQIALDNGTTILGRISAPDAVTLSSAVNVRVHLDTQLFRPVS
jgi:hypothetical protein